MGKVPRVLGQRVIADIRAYKTKHDIGMKKLAKVIGISHSVIFKWFQGQCFPTKTSIAKIVKAGVSDVVLPEQLREKAIEKVLVSVDDKNKVPRKYTRRVSVPDVVRREVAYLLDVYASEQKDSKTWAEHCADRDNTILKLISVCKQGG